MRVNRVGVVGAGVIGTSTAQDLAQTGHEVLLIDVTDEILEQARKQIAANARFHHALPPTRPQNTKKGERVWGSSTVSTSGGTRFPGRAPTGPWMPVEREIRSS